MKEVSIHGYREDLKQYFRSKMEANYARFLEYMRDKGKIKKWEYESKEFEFKKIKRGNRYYKPDFKVTDINDEYNWAELKGYFRLSDKTKLRRFKKFYPEEFLNLFIVIPDKYSRSKSNGEMIGFIIAELGIRFEDIVSFKDIENCRSFIPDWE